MIKSTALAILLVVLVAFLGFQYYITSVPDLAEPISVEESRFIERDNSLLVTLQGHEGRQFTLGLRGDIASAPEETALFLSAIRIWCPMFTGQDSAVTMRNGCWNYSRI